MLGSVVRVIWIGKLLQKLTLNTSPGVQSVRHFVDTFCSQFQKMRITGLQTHLKILIRSTLKSTDPGASNGGSNFEIRPLEADLVSFEVAMLPEKRARLCRQNSKMGQDAYETENSKLSETVGESSGQMLIVPTDIVNGLRAK